MTSMLSWPTAKYAIDVGVSTPAILTGG